MTVTVDLDPRIAEHRRELTGYCYRMLGSAADADDAVQEVMVRAWKGLDRFGGRSSVRTWLYRIATNVCLDQLAARKRRALPVDMSPAPSPPVSSSLGTPLVETAFVEPIPTDRLPAADPADKVMLHESIRLAFVAALQHLPAKQRAVLILCEVLRWKAQEAAELLETSVASVNSALQRARATMAELQADETGEEPLDEERATLLQRYVEAFEAYDMTRLATLLADDAIQSMPPYSLWLSGRDDVIAWMVGPGAECRNSTMVPIDLNGAPGLAQYKPDPKGGYAPWGLHLLDIYNGRVQQITIYLGARLFEQFGLPAHLDSAGA